jgi:uncharacterized protein HemX
MSFGFTAATWMAIGAGTSAAVAINSSNEAGFAADRQKSAQEQATKAAQKQAGLADQANNAANQKAPNMQALLSDNAMAAKGGISGTMLTGPSGIDSKSLTLGKNTLLGGS